VLKQKWYIILTKITYKPTYVVFENESIDSDPVEFPSLDSIYKKRILNYAAGQCEVGVLLAHV
jgi:hypothetical protein